MASEQSSGERTGAFAARVLEQLYAVIYGEPPVGVRSWCEDGSMMLVLRLAGPAPFGGFQPDQPEHPGLLPYAAIPELVAAAVRVQTGRELGLGSWSVDADLGLVTFVFRLPLESTDGQRFRRRDDLPREWPSEVVPAWNDVASIGEATQSGERDHLRLVGDEREPRAVKR
jgi:hypothetical protein